jgi:type IV pilus assembly protein PilW
MTHDASARTRALTQRGFTLVELMISLLIGLFLAGGLIALVGAMKRTSTQQTGLSNLQDSERLTMTLLTDVIQTAGYFPNVAGVGSTSPAVAFPAVAASAPVPAFAAGQAIAGTGAYADPAPGNLISIRYAAAPSDNVINCTGNTNTTATTANYINTFSIVGGNLQCLLTINGVVQPAVKLASGITSVQIYYGVKTASTTTNSVDTYLDAASVTSGAYWPNVMSVKILVTFVNPLAGQPGQPGSGTIPFERIISVMQKTGVIT